MTDKLTGMTKSHRISHHEVVSEYAERDTSNLDNPSLRTSTYGYDLKEKDEYMPVIKKAVEVLTTSQGIGFMVDKLPICMFQLDYVPYLHLTTHVNSEIWLVAALFIH